MPAKAKGKIFEVKKSPAMKVAAKSFGSKNDVQVRYHVYSSGKAIRKKQGVVIKKRKILILRELDGEIIQQKLVTSK